MPNGKKQKKVTEENNPTKKRQSVRVAHELMHFALAEQKKRKGHGLPHTKVTDIMDEWLTLGAANAGYRHPEDE